MHRSHLALLDSICQLTQLFHLLVHVACPRAPPTVCNIQSCKIEMLPIAAVNDDAAPTGTLVVCKARPAATLNLK
jgi:hypothetical protein